MQPERAGAGGAVARPAVDVVVPFRGSATAFTELLERLAPLQLRADDTLTVVDNRPPAVPEELPEPARGAVIRAPERQSSYFARNRGAARGSAEWIVFIDADTEPSPTLLDDYFTRPPAERVAILGGGVTDMGPRPGERRSIARMFAEKGRILDQLDSFDRDERPGFVKTANEAVRRTAFERIGGFRDDVRSGGDVVLCFDVREAGWEIESREEARVLHHGRTTVRALMRQYARWGSGAAWVNRMHPGFHPAKGLRLAPITVRRIGGAARAFVRGDRDGAKLRLVDLLVIWSFELARLYPNRVR